MPGDLNRLGRAPHAPDRREPATSVASQTSVTVIIEHSWHLAVTNA